MGISVNEGASSKRRGRPYRFPEDHSSLTRVHGGVDQRVAWLLSASRIHAGDQGVAHRDQFVEVLKRNGVAADPARVSRWESGAQKVPARVISAYEAALGLAPDHMAAAVKGLRRSLDPSVPQVESVLLPATELYEDLDRLFEAVERAHSHGSDWLALTSYLATHPQIYLRDRSWAQLTESLISQMGRAVGTAYTRRFEALRTLVRHPGAQRHVVKTIGAFVTDPAAQVVMHPLTLLQEVDHPRAGEIAMRMLTTGSGILQQGAAWTAAAKLSRGHFDKDSLRQLEGTLLMLLAAGPRSQSDIDVLDVAARLPDDGRGRLLLALRDSPAVPRLEQLVRTGEVLPLDVTRRVAHNVADSAQRATPAPYHIEPDMMLHRLVREALFHGHQERRHQSSVLLNVSPYRAGVAHGLVRAVDHSDNAVGVRAAQLLRYVATESQRGDLLRWAADPARPKIRANAIITLGRLPEGLRLEDEPAVLDALASGDESLQRAALYALGMSGSPTLSRLAECDDEFQSRAATWWTNAGPAIHERSAI